MKPRFRIWAENREIPLLSSSPFEEARKKMFNPGRNPLEWEGEERGGVSPATDERGAALVLALLVMMVLAVFSTVAIMSATQGLRISGKYKTEQQATYTADGGADFAAGLIKWTIGNKYVVSPPQSATPTATEVAMAAAYFGIANGFNTAGDATTDLEKEIAGINGNSDNAWTSLTGAAMPAGLNPDTAKTNPNATVIIMGDTANIDIDFMYARQIAGEGAESASGYEGLGGKGRKAKYFQVDTYTKIGETEKTVRAIYKCVGDNCGK